MRDTVQTLDYFNNGIAFKEMVINSDKDKVGEIRMHGGRAMQVHSLREYSCMLVLQRYSRGDDLADMQSSVTQMALMFKLKAETMPTLTDLTQSEKEMWTNLGISKLFDCLWCLAFMVGMHYSKSDLKLLLGWIGHEGEDGLLDRIAVLLGDEQRIVKEHSKFEKHFDPLIQVMEAHHDDQPRLLEKYIKTWYNRMKAASWHNTHKGEAYCGYWCFEAALVAMLLNIDDSLVREHLYYPNDLVLYYRANKK